LIDDAGKSVAVVSGFLRHLAARGCSPNTLTAYAYDLRHLWTFLAEQQLAWDELRPRHALGLLEFLRSVPSRSPRQRLALTLATLDAGGPSVRLSPTTVNRALAAIASFYEYTLVAGLFEASNPIERRSDPALETLPHEGYPVSNEDLVHLAPTLRAHVNPYAKCSFDVEGGMARTGFRPLGELAITASAWAREQKVAACL